ncbi:MULTISPECIES: hypothetical protein [unclassified Azospirillum]|uniref:hypothetical protein n=1 Tax=unclassified Azospirillum TaxID=2630922 RepID=UPI0011774BE7|nr:MULTISPECIES: hypothetical protein [unclassified Azospirillum]
MLVARGGGGSTTTADSTAPWMIKGRGGCGVTAGVGTGGGAVITTCGAAAVAGGGGARAVARGAVPGTLTGICRVTGRSVGRRTGVSSRTSPAAVRRVASPSR